uniref:Phosphatidylinositol Nacetylglucosaminyltransferase subunit Q putative n=1 Tax=Albugo laibachii Nc14 TaxID=890382 RepID=F0W826_9STRA|nr:phosphatidylinositol Nacetylglucosaminyltransferase subunit Q putative [Albugo laibachii Nc14]|eukprot:CCA17279.1 phosphatidylinositol Nacetylglucosaminyltransferase subunit Q putative [Albugo laibachii Nc14]
MSGRSSCVLFWPRSRLTDAGSTKGCILGFQTRDNAFCVTRLVPQSDNGDNLLISRNNNKNGSQCLGYYGGPHDVPQWALSTKPKSRRKRSISKQLFASIDTESTKEASKDPTIRWIVYDSNFILYSGCNVILYDPISLLNRFGPTLDTTFIAQPTLEEPLRRIGQELITTRRKRRPPGKWISAIIMLLLQVLVSILYPTIKLFRGSLYIIERVLVVNGVNLTNVSILIAICCCQMRATIRFFEYMESFRSSQSRRDISLSRSQVWMSLEMLDFFFSLLLNLWLQQMTQSIIGLLASSFLSPLAFIELLQANVLWLMGSPAGFKLNVPLASIFGNGIILWLDVCRFFFDSIAVIPKVTASYSVLNKSIEWIWNRIGLMIKLSLILDLVYFSTWNSRYIFNYFMTLNMLQMKFLKTLWRLFLGLKLNVLRKRIDSCDYDIPELLLGTLLFTIVVFLMTTYIVFFAFFAIIRLQIRLIEMFLWIIIGGIRCTSFGLILYRLWNPTFFAKSVHLNLSQNCIPTFSKTLDDSAPPVQDSQHALNNSHSPQKESSKQPVVTIYSLEFSSIAPIALIQLRCQKMTKKLASHLKNWEQFLAFIFLPTGDIDLILEPMFEPVSFCCSEKAI